MADVVEFTDDDERFWAGLKETMRIAFLRTVGSTRPFALAADRAQDRLKSLGQSCTNFKIEFSQERDLASDDAFRAFLSRAINQVRYPLLLALCAAEIVAEEAGAPWPEAPSPEISGPVQTEFLVIEGGKSHDPPPIEPDRSGA